jgi:hypothetical protein
LNKKLALEELEYIKKKILKIYNSKEENEIPKEKHKKW